MENRNKISPTLVRLGTKVDALEQRILQEQTAAAIEIMRDHAPGRVAEGITAVTVGKVIELHANAKTQFGYDYVGVTRFGHRVKVIRPTRRTRAPASVVSTKLRRRSPRLVGRKPALRLVNKKGEVSYRYSVPGYSPAFDWAKRGQEEITRDLGRRVQRAARDIKL